MPETLLRDFEALIARVLADTSERPLTVQAAMRYAVGGGKRYRPRLLFAVMTASASGELDATIRDLAIRAAIAMEMAHCGSLVIDDLPCFDGALERRGKPTVWEVYGEAMGLLTGDALLITGLETLAGYPGERGLDALRLSHLFMRTLGMEGLVGGQNLEIDPNYPEISRPDLHPPSAAVIERYHDLKTSGFFSFAAMAGALLARCSAEDQRRWADIGRDIGRMAQIADDLIDVLGGAFGKTNHRDKPLGRPNWALAFGEAEAARRVAALGERIIANGESLPGFPFGVINPLRILFSIMRELGHPMAEAETKLGIKPATGLPPGSYEE